MGREVRKVPPNWEHPNNGYGHLQPMYDRTYDEAATEWMKEFDEFRADPKQQASALESDCKYYWDWSSMPPDKKYYRPYSAESATWFQLWETVSEGTPVSPPFATADELAQYLAVNGDDWDRKRGHGGWGIERAQAFVKAGWAPSLVVFGNTVLESKDIPLDADRARGREA